MPAATSQPASPSSSSRASPAGSTPAPSMRATRRPERSNHPSTASFNLRRETGYKWIDRYLRHGPVGLEERSRRPARSPNETAEEIVTALVTARQRNPSWGGKKLLALLHKQHPRWELPGRSTGCEILKRHGIGPRRRSP